MDKQDTQDYEKPPAVSGAECVVIDHVSPRIQTRASARLRCILCILLTHAKKENRRAVPIGCGLALLGILLPGCPGGMTTSGGNDPPPCPSGPELWVSGRYVKQVIAGSDGSVWAATDGGVLEWPAGGGPARRWTTADGLRSSDIRAISLAASGIYIATALDLHQLQPDGRVLVCGANSTAPLPRSNAPVPPSTLPSTPSLFHGEEIRCMTTSLRRLEKLWVGTSGGIYLHTRAGWQQTLEGEAWRMASDGKHHWAITSKGLIRLDDEQGFPLPSIRGSLVQTPLTPEDLGAVTALAVSSNGVTLATALGTWTFNGGRWRRVALPRNSDASHVSALASGPGGVSGLYGDGLYRLIGGAWKRRPGSPPDCRFTTALARTDTGLLAGTRTGGVWLLSETGWARLPLPHSLPAADIYCLAGYRRSLWAGTFDGGILRIDGQHVTTITKHEGLSSNSPRGFLVFQGSLFVRYASGQLDRFDGVHWRPAFGTKELVRPEIYSFATDGRRLYLGGCEGWQATDGKQWETHYHEPELKGQVLTTLAVRNGALWMGTQEQGLFRFEEGRIVHYHEAHGLTDDWITCLAFRGNRLLVGTYTGGLLERQGDRFAPLMKAGSFAIRAIAFRPDGTALAATPLGLYQESNGGWQLLEPSRYGGAETQCLLSLAGGVWVGSRTVLAFVPGGE